MDNNAKDVEAAASATSQPPPYAAGSQDPIVTSDPPPPSYGDAVHTGAQPSDPPPSYESIYGKVKAAKADSTGLPEFFKKFLVIILGTLGCTVMLAIVMAIPVAMIVIGALYKDKCPAERMIPIYLIVAGSFGILKNLSSLLQRCKNKDEPDADEKNAKTNPFDSTLNCFLFAWFIAGNVWIYRTHNNFSTDSADPSFCDPTLYYFAFWVTTATYILIGTVCCCVCCGGIIAGCFGGD